MQLQRYQRQDNYQLLSNTASKINNIFRISIFVNILSGSQSALG